MNEKIRKRYNLLSKVYDILDLAGTGNQKKTAVDVLEFSADAKVMDIGSGTSAIIPYLASRLESGHVTCVDFSENMVKEANKRFRKKAINKKAKAVVADATKLPFPNNHFDAVLATFAFTSFSEPEKAIRECARVLKRGGTISILDTGKLPKRNPYYYSFLKNFMWLIGYTDITINIPKIVTDSGLKIMKRKYFPMTSTYIITACK